MCSSEELYMNEVSNKVELIRVKLEKVGRRMEELSTENDTLRRNNADLERQLNLQKRKIESMQTEHSRVKLAKTLVANSGEKAEMKFRVNELVREIDKCIALLNR